MDAGHGGFRGAAAERDDVGKNAGIGQRGMALLCGPALQAGDVAFGRGRVAQRHQRGQGRALRRFKAPDLVHFPLQALNLLGQVERDGPLQALQHHHDAGHLGLAVDVAKPLQLEGEGRRAVGELRHDRRGQGVHGQAVGVVAQQQVEGLQVLLLQGEKGHVLDHQQAVQGTGQVPQGRGHQVAGCLLAGQRLADVAELVAAQGLDDQGIGGIQGADAAQAGQGRRAQLVVGERVQGRRLQLAVLGQQAQEQGKPVPQDAAGHPGRRGVLCQVGPPA